MRARNVDACTEERTILRTFTMSSADGIKAKLDLTRKSFQRDNISVRIERETLAFKNHGASPDRANCNMLKFANSECLCEK